MSSHSDSFAASGSSPTLPRSLSRHCAVKVTRGSPGPSATQVVAHRNVAELVRGDAV